MKRSLDMTPEEGAKEPARKMRRKDVGITGEALRFIAFRAGLPCSHLEEEIVYPSDHEDRQASEPPNVPRHMPDLANLDIPSGCQYIQSFLDGFLDKIGNLTNIPARLEERSEIVAVEAECDLIWLRLKLMGLEVTNDDDVLKLEDEIRFQTSAPEAQLRMTEDDLDEIYMEADLKSRNERGSEDSNNDADAEDEETKRAALQLIRSFLQRMKEAEVDEEESSDTNGDSEVALREEALLEKGDKWFKAALEGLGCLGDGSNVETLDPEGDEDDEAVNEYLQQFGCFS